MITHVHIIDYSNQSAPHTVWFLGNMSEVHRMFSICDPNLCKTGDGVIIPECGIIAVKYMFATKLRRLGASNSLGEPRIGMRIEGMVQCACSQACGEETERREGCLTIPFILGLSHDDSRPPVFVRYKHQWFAIAPWDQQYRDKGDMTVHIGSHVSLGTSIEKHCPHTYFGTYAKFRY